MANYEIINIKVGDIDLDYLKFGHGSKNLVVSPGLSLSSPLLASGAIVKTFEVFVEEYTVYIIDVKKNLSDVYSLYTMADDIKAVVDKLALTDIYLYGTSRGGVVCQIFASKYSNLVKKLAIASSLCLDNSNTSSLISKWIDLAKNHKIEELNHSIYYSIYSQEFLDRYDKAFKMLEKNGTNEECDNFYYQAKGLENIDIREDIKNIKCPTIVLGSKNDVVTPASGQILIRDIIDCEIYLYDKFNHAVYDEADDFRDRLFKFFQK